MLYTSPWDCSSIGQSTALSRRKLRVRAPSVPTSDPMRWIHQFLSPLSSHKGDKEQDPVTRRDPKFPSFFDSNEKKKMGIPSTSINIDWWERDICSRRYHHTHDSKRDNTAFAFAIAPDLWNRIEYLYVSEGYI